MNQTDEILRLNRLLCGLKTRHENVVAEKNREIERLQDRVEAERIRGARYEREYYRLRRIELSAGRLQKRLEAKEKALRFAVKRQEVLRRQLSEALGKRSYPYRAAKALTR